MAAEVSARRVRRRALGAPSIAGPASLSLAVAVISYPLPTIGAAGAGLERDGGSPLAWFAVATLAYLIAMVAVLPVRRFVVGDRSDSARAALALAVFAFAGMVRGVALALVPLWLGMKDESRLAYHLIQGAAIAVVLLSLVTLLVDARYRHRRALADLEAERDQLLRARSEAEGAIAANADELRDRVEVDLLGPVEDFRAAIGTGAQRAGGEASERLLELVDAALKPLADDLRGSGERWAPGIVEQGRPPLVFREVFAASTVVAPFRPLLVALLVSVTGAAPAWIAARSAWGLVAAATVFLALAFAFAFARRSIAPRLRPLGDWSRFSLVSAVYVAAGLLGAGCWFAVMAFAGLPPEPTFGLLTVPWTVIFAGLGAVAAAWQRRQESVESELAAVVEALAVEVAQANQVLEADRARLARVVHGPVQATLLAAASRLRQSAATGEFADADIAVIVESLGEARALFDRADAAVRPLGEVVGEFADVWAGVAGIECSIDPEVDSLLRADPAAAMVVMEIVREAISNAVRHSSASWIEVDAAPSGSGEGVELRVVSDGFVPERRPSRSGSGTAILDRSTISWALEARPGGGSLLTATVPSRRSPVGLVRPG